MKLKRIMLLLFVAALIIPTSSFANGWSNILSGTYTATSYGTNTSTAYSGGGYVRVCQSGVAPKNTVDFQLYTNEGERIGPIMKVYNSDNSSSPYQCFGSVYVDHKVDGSNNKAELYLKLVSENISSDSVYVVIQD